MARVGYYVITDEQAAILEEYGFTDSLIQLGGLYCVTDWISTQNAIMAALDATYDDEDESNDAPESYFTTMDIQAEYMYWSTEAHSWVQNLK